MKLVKIAIVLILISIFRVSEQKDCQFVFKNKNDIPKSIDRVDAIFYQDKIKSKEYETAKKNALYQGAYARNLFYDPNPTAIEMIKKAAKNLRTIINKPGYKETFTTFIAENNRQMTPTGTLRNRLLEAVFRMVILKKYKITANEIALTKVLNSIINDKKPDEQDLLGFLGFIGDFGASIMDVVAKKRKDEVTQTLLQTIRHSFPNLDFQLKAYYERYSPEAFYTTKSRENNLKQDKAIERFICSTKADKAEAKTDERVGLLNLGRVADGYLGRFKNRLPLLGWQWQAVPGKLAKFCPTEPWAGHVSGSFHEIVFMLELLNLSEDKEGRFDAQLVPVVNMNSVSVAWSSAFLLASGMHSAIEVAWPAMRMLGYDLNAFNIDPSEKNKENLNTLKTKLCEKNASTDFFRQLHQGLSTKQVPEIK